MAVENFSTYTLDNPYGFLSRTSTRCTWTAAPVNDAGKLYDDKGVDHFNGDFTHYMEAYFDLYQNVCWYGLWMMANVVDCYQQIQNASGNALAVMSYDDTTIIVLQELNGGVQYGDNSVTLNQDQLYYLTIVRDEAVGTYGTFYCYIYSDSSRTTLVDTVSIALHGSKKDYRYIYGAVARSSGSTGTTATGYSQNLDLNEFVPPTDLSTLYIPRRGVTEEWTSISGVYSSVPIDTNTLAMSDTSFLWVGAPIAFTISGTTYCARVKSITTNSSIDIQGAPLSGSVTALYVGRSEMMKYISLFVPSTYGDGVENNLLTTDAKSPVFNRLGGIGYVVHFECSHATVDTGTEPKVNLEVNNAVVSTNDSNNGVQLGAANTFVANSDVAINTTNYDWQDGEELEVACKAAGGTGDASDLTVNVMVIVTKGLP